jgi:hypothetical protein
MDLTTLCTAFPPHLWTPEDADAVRVCDQRRALVAALHAFFAKHNPTVDDRPLGRDFRAAWTTLDLAEAALGQPRRLVGGERFFRAHGTCMVALPYVLLENNACAVVLIAPAETPDETQTPFELHPRAWRLSSLLVPVFVPCACIRKK